MTVPSLKTLCNSLKYVDKPHSFFRAGTYFSTQYGPKQRNLECREAFSRHFCVTSPLQQGLLRYHIGTAPLTRISELENSRSDVSRGRDFMNLSGATSTKSLTATAESGANFYFDTHKLVTTLQSHGFSLDQAETITDCLTEILTNGATGMSKYMVSYLEVLIAFTFDIPGSISCF